MSSRRERVLDVHPDVLPSQGNVLLLAPSIGGAERDACTDLLAQEDFSSTNALHVLFMESARERFELLDRRIRDHPHSSAVIAVGAGGTVGDRGPEPDHDDYHVQTLTDPADLTGLGIEINRCLGRWDDADVDVALCFDSLSILLQYVDLERVFRFLHMITGRLADLDATAHFHIDPAAHEPRVVAQLAQVFDSQVEVTNDGDQTVRR